MTSSIGVPFGRGQKFTRVYTHTLTYILCSVERDSLHVLYNLFLALEAESNPVGIPDEIIVM